jgi:hypothetical protein
MMSQDIPSLLCSCYSVQSIVHLMLYCVGISEVSFRDMYGEVGDEGCPPFIREHVHHIQKESSGRKQQKNTASVRSFQI